MQKKILIHLFFLLCTIILHLNIHSQPIPSLIIDTDGKDAYYYQTLKYLARSCNFECSYKNVYSMLESPTIDDKKQVLFFFANLRMVNQDTHEITQELRDILKTFSRKCNKLIMLLLPNNAPVEKLSTLLDAVELPHTIPAQSMAKLYLALIGHSNAHTGKQYGTSLINKSKNNTNTLSTYKKAHTLPKSLLLLPHIQDGIHNCNEHPLAITVHNKKTNTIIALMPATDCTFADVAENFHKNPHNSADRNHMLARVQELLWQLNALHTKQTLPTQPAPPLPQCFTHMHKKSRTHKKSFSAAWLEPKDYYLGEEPHALQEHKQQAITQGCKFLHDCNFNLLWFEVNPEWYFSPVALFKKNTDAVMNAMKNVGIQLTSYCKQSGSKMPQIFVGSDITSNFNGQKPKSCVYDLFGNAYPNVPSPFDRENLWEQELIAPFTTCHTQLKQHTPINGLFLDFEMYHAPKQASSYHDLMDFSECAWNVFKKAYATVPDCNSVRERVAYLKKQKLFSQYFKALTQAAHNIGTYIKQQLHIIDPALRIAIYAPTLPNSWFYRGIISGLSSKKQPLITATFNTDFHRHTHWLKKNNMHITHGTALMMSKLECDNDFVFVKKLSQQHDFVWYNRPSRQVYQQVKKHPSNKWWQAEYSTLHNTMIANRINAVHTQK